MKAKFFALFLFLLIGASIQTQAQLSECQITYDIDFSNSDMDPMALAMMEGAKMTMMFKEDKMRIEMDMNMMKSTILRDEEAKEGVVLTDMMGMKMAMVMGKDEFEDEADYAPTIKETGKTKKIAGYTCNQVIVTDADGNKFELWYSPKIKPSAKASGYSYAGIDGFPLEMEVDQDGNRMKMTAIEVNTDRMDSELFEVTIPAGYKEMSVEEMMQMGGGR